VRGEGGEGMNEQQEYSEWKKRLSHHAVLNIMATVLRDLRKAKKDFEEAGSAYYHARSSGDERMMKLAQEKQKQAYEQWRRSRYGARTDGRVPPYVFRDYRTVSKLLEAGFIEPWVGYGAPMYKFTHHGLDALESKS
jgi:hypothetical protein